MASGLKYLSLAPLVTITIGVQITLQVPLDGGVNYRGSTHHPLLQPVILSEGSRFMRAAVEGSLHLSLLFAAFLCVLCVSAFSFAVAFAFPVVIPKGMFYLTHSKRCLT